MPAEQPAIPDSLPSPVSQVEPIPAADQTPVSPLPSSAVPVAQQYGQQPNNASIDGSLAAPPSFGAEAYQDSRLPLPDDLSDEQSLGPDLAWETAEFTDHSKTAKWYAALLGVTVLVAGLIYFATRDVISVVVVIICAGLFGYMAGRRPRMMGYGVSDAGIFVGNKFHSYHDFKAFSVMEETDMVSIEFLPLKRFAPMLNIHCDHQHADAALSIISQYLSFAEREHAPVDRLMRRIRF